MNITVKHYLIAVVLILLAVYLTPAKGAAKGAATIGVMSSQHFVTQTPQGRELQWETVHPFVQLELANGNALMLFRNSYADISPQYSHTFGMPGLRSSSVNVSLELGAMWYDTLTLGTHTVHVPSLAFLGGYLLPAIGVNATLPFKLTQNTSLTLGGRVTPTYLGAGISLSFNF